MYNGTKIKREKNPKENANFLSKFLFIFALKTIKKGICHNFKEEDIYEIMEDYKSEKLGKHMEELWNVQLKRSDPSLMRCLIKMFGIEYMLLGLAFFTYETSTLIIQPILTGKLVSYFEPNTQVTQKEATMYAAGILACISIFFLLDHTYFLLLQQICLKVKICLSALVYRKCLKLNLSGLPNFGSGMPITLITKDTMQFDTPLDCGHMFFNGVIQLIIMTALMYRKIGVSALVGTLFLFILIPTQVILGYKILAYRVRTSAFTDQRVRITQEILTAIRIIKMYTWELFFLKIVNKLRRVDMEQDVSGFKFNKTINAMEYRNLDDSRKIIMIQYSLVILGAVLFKVLTAFAFYMFASKASINIHVLLLNNVLNAGMGFFDSNLSGNVLNRFSRDLGIIDEQMPFVMFTLTDSILTLFGSLFIVTSVNIYFLAPSLIILVILIIGKKIYLLTARSIRRLEGSTRSPVIGHLNATLEGLTTIRANKAQEILKNEFDQHQNLYNSATYMYMSTARAFAFYLSTIGFFYILIITYSFLFMKTESTAGEIGLAITQSFTVTHLLFNTIRNWADLEIQMTSTERVVEYIKSKPEDCSGSKILNWPKMGKVAFDKVNLRYLSSCEPVLKNVSFIIQPCEKIGIVGRTGAGKSSIISSLFKLYQAEGKISIDDVDITDIESSFLRSKISIIPQDPVLFSGTVRSNLDPYEIHTDEDLWKALEEVKMKNLIRNLNSIISEGGVNYSIGQRQLFCLARALLRNNTILVLDEATANVDSNVDELIQNILKTAFSNYTVIIIAHRLSTIINCDKVLVMDLGTVIEYDSPLILLTNKEGMFYKMVEEAGLLQ